MSADSPRRTVRGVPAIVPPQVVSDPSIIDSVAGFINDVALTNQPQLDPKDTITWAKFESQADVSDLQFGEEDWELEGCAPPPLILILGYGVGIQVWSIPANGEAVEVLTWRHGNVTALRVLPTPTTNDVNFDRFSDKRPLLALCEGPTSNSGPQYSTVNFVSLKDGSTVKSIKFKNPVLDILTNKTFVGITFPERIAVFDARSLDDHLSITTCYPSPGINPNPVALGHRWLAYSENKLIHTKRSQGGCEVEGVPSYTAAMLNAAKSLGKGLKELGETVAAGLKGSSGGSGSSSKPGSFDSGLGDTKQAGVVTIFDIKNPIRDISPTSGTPISVTGDDPIVAHFVAHSDAIVAMEFDPSGMLLITADKRGHDFHIFKIYNHAMSSNLSAVHHLYILHRGDTTAKVQNIAFSPDSRWVAVSTLRGTTHVFPITPYGGPAGVRTHTNPHVVNRLSRFHRSAGLSADGRSSSPISSHSEIVQYNPICMPYNNAMIPPFPKPVVVNPLAKLRQPSALGSPPGSAQNSYSRSSHGRQRLSSLSDDNGKPLSVCAVFAKARSWLLDGPKLGRDPHKVQQKVVDSLFIMAGHGALIQYDLDVKTAQNVAKDKVCDESAIELDVEAKAQWNLGRKDNSVEIQPPLPPDNWLLKDRSNTNNSGGSVSPQIDDWVSQVEIMTHAGPGRRLWMGPQCVFKTYNTPSGSSLNHIDTEAVEVPINVGSSRPGRSSPMNMPLSNSERSSVPFVIESGSYSSIEQSPRLIEKFCHNNLNSEYDLAQGESRLKEDLADAMRDLPSGQHKDTGLTPRVRKSSLSPMPSTSSINSGSDISCIAQGTDSTSLQQLEINTVMSSQNQPTRSVVLIEKVVNPQGTVTTITRSPNDNEYDPNDPYAWLDTDYVIHENFDEALFRPVVTIFCDNQNNPERKSSDFELVPPEPIRTDLIIPVIEESYPDVECGKPPELIKTELVVPVVEERKKKPTKEKIQKRDEYLERETEIVDQIVEKSDDVPSANRKSKANKKNNSMGAVKEKSPPKQKVLDVEDPPNSSYENENYGNSSKKNTGRFQTDPELEEIQKTSKIHEKTTLEIDQRVMNAIGSKIDDTSKIKSRKSEEREVRFEKTQKSTGKNRKTSRVEIVDDISTKCDVLEETQKSKPEKLAKTRVMTQEGNQKKMPRVSSDTKITKCKNTTMNAREMASSCVELKHAVENELSLRLEAEKTDDKESNMENEEHFNVTKTSEESGLHFYDKFGLDSPKSKTSTENKMEHIQIEVEFPSLGESLTENKKTKKQKSSNPVCTSPQVSPKVSKKISQNNDHKLSDDDAAEIVTITLPSKKKQKGNVSENQGKGCEQGSEKYGKCPSPSVDKTDSIEIKEKFGKKGKNGKKSKEVPKLPLEAALNSNDFPDNLLPPLSPLEPFESNFESLHFNDPADENDSLINLDSPPQDKLSNKNTKTSSTNILNESVESTDIKTPNSGYENLIFALCGSLHYDTPLESSKLSEDPQISSSTTNTSVTTSTVVTVKKYSKTSHRKSSSENDEQYLSLEPNYNENTSSSSEEIEESACLRKKTRQKLIDDDEELRPLISGANSACSMTSSTSGKKEDDTPSIALEIAKAIVDTLPDSNQSDSSDQANISEPDASDTTGLVGTAANSSGRAENDSSPKVLPQLDLIGNGSSGNLHQNGKKKLKKKKR